MKTKISTFLLLATFLLLKSQEMPISYAFGEKYNDRYKYSNLLTIIPDGQGGSLLIRSYYTGLILKPKGYFLEHYNKNLELVSEYNYKITDVDLVNGYLINGQLNLLFLEYNEQSGSYDYTLHRSDLSAMEFERQVVLTIPSAPVENPLDKNYYNRNFSSGFTTSVFFNLERTAFAVSAHFKKGKDNRHFIHLFNDKGERLMELDFSAEIEEKNYAFEDMVVSDDLKDLYLIGKAYYKKKRFAITDRKFQYEVLNVSVDGSKTQTFDENEKYSEALKPILMDGRLLFVGFYADRKDNRYNGLAYFELNPSSLEIISKKYHPFSQQFMTDKFGKEDDRDIKNLVFKSVGITANKEILYNAEEYFVTSSVQQDVSGSRLHIDRYHYNDIVSAKLDASGEMRWVRNINKSEVTQNDAAYASYSSLTLGDKTYFFISTASENPQQLGNDRIIFRQGYSRNRNVFLIELDAEGNMHYEKVLDDQEARLPLMVSIPLYDPKGNNMLFYAKRGSKKQLVRINFDLH